jgi:hypothetical protein
LKKRWQHDAAFQKARSYRIVDAEGRLGEALARTVPTCGVRYAAARSGLRDEVGAARAEQSMAGRRAGLYQKWNQVRPSGFAAQLEYEWRARAAPAGK